MKQVGYSEGSLRELRSSRKKPERNFKGIGGSYLKKIKKIWEEGTKLGINK